MTRAVQAVVAAGVSVARVEVDKDGRIIVVAGEPQTATAATGGWDKAIAELEK